VQKKENSGLSAKQEQFCQEYLVDYNGTQAAIRAGYSPKTAMEQASRLLSKVKISDRLAELRKPIIDILEANREKIIQVALNEVFKGDPNTTVLNKLLDKLAATKTDSKSEVTVKNIEDFLDEL